MINAWDIIVRLVLSFLLGSFIGFEREKRGRSAGFRTHILVCTGACLVMLVSIYMYELYQGDVPLDPSRIAAGVVTGIGFLGAGTIIRSAQEVHGLTTAASVWINAAIGLALGCGFFLGAFITAVIAFVTLSFLKLIEVKLDKK